MAVLDTVEARDPESTYTVCRRKNIGKLFGRVLQNPVSGHVEDDSR
jgi:hypothetical protein